MTNSAEYPLLGLFQEWQQFDIDQKRQALDIEVYFQLLEAVNQGIGLWSRDELFALCRLVLVKPHHVEPPHSILDFKEKFDRYLAALQTAAEKLAEMAEPQDGDNESTGQLKKQGGNSSEADNLREVNQGSSGDTPTTPPSVSGSVETKPEIAEAPAYLQFGEDGDEPVANDVGENPNELITKFQFQTHYLPVDSRSMQQNIRSLRQQDFRRQKLVFDLNDTLNRIAQRGYFDQLSLKRAWTNQVPLVLLFDRQGSMVAFHAFCDELSSEALKTVDRQPKGQTAIYYFWNCPLHQLFRTTRLTNPISLTDWKRLHANAQVVIVSDAGAARGYYSEERLGRTKWFLDQLAPRNLVWLNPMPRNRWKGTSAKRIAEWVTMFTIDSIEFNNAFKYLKKLR